MFSLEILLFLQDHINRGQKTAETDAYCGRYSLKNPAVLFDSADVKPNRLPYGDISLFPYNQVSSTKWDAN